MISFYRPSADGALDFNLGPARAGGVLARAVFNLRIQLETVPHLCIKEAYPVPLKLA